MSNVLNSCHRPNGEQYYNNGHVAPKMAISSWRETGEAPQYSVCEETYNDWHRGVMLSESSATWRQPTIVVIDNRANGLTYTSPMAGENNASVA